MKSSRPPGDGSKGPQSQGNRVRRATVGAAALGAVTVLIASCFGGGGGGGGGVSVSVKIFGHVTDSSHQVVAGATVRLRAPSSGGSEAGTAADASTDGQTTTTTDATGAFALEGTVDAAASQAMLDISAAKFAPQLTFVPLKAGVLQYQSPVTMYPLQEQAVQPNQPTTVAVTLMGRQVQITLPAGTQAGLRVQVAAIDPNEAPPGALRAAGSDPATALQSVGMFYFTVVDENGNPAPPVAGMKVVMAPINAPAIPDAEPFNAWQMNDQGEWANPVALPAPGGPMMAAFSLPQFGFWNADRNFRTACVKGKLKTGAGSCGGAHVQATGPDGISSFDSSGSDGSFCVMGAQTFASTLKVGGATVPMQMPSSAGGCNAPESCKDIGVVSVPDSACGEAGGGPDGGVDSGADSGPCDFKCTSGECLLAANVCDKNPDCPGGEDEDPAVCLNENSCCVATKGCPGETGGNCAAGCCCCPSAQACCADPSQGCCAAP
jgi:hypothetical protein